MDYAGARARVAIRAEPPAWIFNKGVRNFALLRRPNSVLFRKRKALRAVHLRANSTARFRMPWMPLAIAHGSDAVVNVRPARRDLKRNDLTASAAVLVIFFGVDVPH